MVQLHSKKFHYSLIVDNFKQCSIKFFLVQLVVAYSPKKIAFITKYTTFTFKNCIITFLLKSYDGTVDEQFKT